MGTLLKAVNTAGGPTFAAAASHPRREVGSRHSYHPELVFSAAPPQGGFEPIPPILLRCLEWLLSEIGSILFTEASGPCPGYLLFSSFSSLCFSKQAHMD